MPFSWDGTSISEAPGRERSGILPQPRELVAISEQLENARTDEVLRWAVDAYGKRLGLSVSFGGAEGMVLLDMISRLTDRVGVITLDTGFLFRETVEFREEMRRRYRLPFEVVRPALSVEEQVERYGTRLYSCSPDLCCQVRKVEPLGRVLEGYEAWMTGIRREQTPHRANTPVVGREERFGVDKISPLASWSEEEVYGYVRKHDVPLNPLLEKGYKSVGCEPQTHPVAEDEDLRAGRWPSLEKTECGLHWAGDQEVG